MNLDFKEFRLATISDIHLGHTKTKTEFVIDNLNKYFCTDEFLSTVDMVVFVGDVFDEMLSLSSDCVPLIKIWVAKFIRYCIKYNILVRVLEGTPSHDRNQSLIFETINEIIFNSTGSVIDLKFVKTLNIEHIQRFGIDVLYVPDEWNHDTADTIVEVKELLKTKGLTKVDFSFMHGCFQYQIPEITKQNIKHIEADYLALTKHLIYIGHVHQYSNYDRIYSQGSFDRLCHGDEKAKGFLYTTFYNDGHYEITFIKNKTAKKYVTIKCHQDDVEESLVAIDKVVSKLPNNSYVRIETKYLKPISGGLDTLKKRWPLLVWTIILKDVQETEESSILVDKIDYVPVIISPDTIENLLLNRLGQFGLMPTVLERCKLHIEDIKSL